MIGTTVVVFLYVHLAASGVHCNVLLAACSDEFVAAMSLSS